MTITSKMPIEIHNFILTGIRLVQVETQSSARLFSAIFNITTEDAEDLRDILLEVVKINRAIAVRKDAF